jgi:hypothetical protein
VTTAEVVFKTGFAPQWSVEQLSALAEACRTDDPRLIQGSTTEPPPIKCMQGWPCDCGCATAYVGAVSLGGFSGGSYAEPRKPATNPDAATVGQVEEFFAHACFAADQLIGEPAECRHFLHWFDDTPREEMRRVLYSWCMEVIRERTGGPSTAVHHCPA